MCSIESYLQHVTSIVVCLINRNPNKQLNDYVTKLEETVKKLENEREADSDRLHSKQQIKELTLQRNKLEAQIKFGLDSFKMEQERARRLEMELAKYSSNIHL